MYNHLRCITIAGLLLAVLLLAAPTAVAAADTPAYAPDRIIIKYLPSNGLDRAAPNALSPAEILADFSDLVPGLQVIKLPDGVTVEEALAYYRNLSGVAYAEPDYYISTQEVPNDPDYGRQWGLTPSASGGITPEPAWDISTGSDDIVVAVIDSGIMVTHEDLEANIWHNVNDPVNGLDDDHNGFVDDYDGWNFVENNNDVSDYNLHGTHCAGIIGALTNNEKGIAGTAWNVQIMPVRTMNQLGQGSTSAIMGGIQYAVNNGADIISMSFGDYVGASSYEEIIRSASDILFVSAAGNDGNNNDVRPHYPASYDCDNILAVAASNVENNLAWFSNYGKTSVDVAAPGVDIFSTVPAIESHKNLITPTISEKDKFGVIDNGWAFDEGTVTVSGKKQSLLYLKDPVNITGNYASLSLIANYTITNVEGGERLYFLISNQTFASYQNMTEVLVNISSGNITAAAALYNHARTIYTYDVGVTSVFSPYIRGEKYYLGIAYFAETETDYATIESIETNHDYQITGFTYKNETGTSMATPMVSGAAAVVKSINPNLTNLEIKKILMDTVDKVGNFAAGEYVASNGRVNLTAAAIAALHSWVEISGTANLTAGTIGTYTISAKDAVSLSVDFGDGTMSDYSGDKVVADHMYVSPGEYTITAVITYAAGAGWKTSFNVTVLPGKPEPSNPVKNETVQKISGGQNATNVTSVVVNASDISGDTPVLVLQDNTYSVPSDYGTLPVNKGVLAVVNVSLENADNPHDLTSAATFRILLNKSAVNAATGTKPAAIRAYRNYAIEGDWVQMPVEIARAPVYDTDAEYAYTVKTPGFSFFTFTAAADASQPVNPPTPVPTPSSGGEDTGSGHYTYYPRSVTDGGYVSFGTSPTVSGVLLPKGVSGEVVLAVTSSAEAPAGHETYTVFEITIPNYPAGESAEIQFHMTTAEIERAGYTPADVCLYHYGGSGWEALPTLYSIEDGVVFYTASTSAFSPFAIVYEAGAASVSVPMTPTEEPEVTVVPTAGETLSPSTVITTATSVVPTKSPVPVFAVISGILTAAVVLMGRKFV